MPESDQPSPRNDAPVSRNPFSGKPLPTMVAAIWSLAATALLLLLGHWLHGHLAGFPLQVADTCPPSGLLEQASVADDLWSWLIKTLVSLLVRLFLIALGISGWWLFIFGALIALLLLIVWKYGAAALEWYYEHPFWAVVAAFLLLTVLVLIMIGVDCGAAAAPPAEGLTLLLTLFLFLLWLFALVLLILAIVSLLVSLYDWFRSKVKKVCLRWVPQWELACQAWQYGCLAYETTVKQTCLAEETQSRRECAGWDAASTACDLLTGWRYWTCKAGTLAGSLLCTSWRVITTTWCKVWGWVKVTACKLTGWLCAAWVWVFKRVICALWG